MTTLNVAATFGALLLIFFPLVRSTYISKQLKDALHPEGDQNIQRLNSAIYYAARRHEQIPYYQGVDVHEYHEIHSLTDVSHNKDQRSRERGEDTNRIRRNRCKGFECENGGTVQIHGGQCVCVCPGNYVGFNCQYKGDRCKSSDYTDCFLRETRVDLNNGYWALNFQHHFLAARARYMQTCNVTSEDLYIGKPYKLTITYTQKARHVHHRLKVQNFLVVKWKEQHKKSRTLFKENFGLYEGTKGSKCINVPLGFGEVLIQFQCINPYTCNVVPPHDTDYIKKKNTSFYIDEVRLEPGKC
ncbi:uncharacterized protein LOC111127824 [Crassostrea virginica]|uniref:Uncharacterized protein LOC111127824 n=1 Tax=Crassostrea virginica TaxID=6565 RepID=A0A8B8DKU1_CRAVI|nr:uncharacterized protein LOC111127824 [Crassostrea virginica]XP_022328792.1 uncharacterized protein LOC111127824 [Crassostrea virginica]